MLPQYELWAAEGLREAIAHFSAHLPVTRLYLYVYIIIFAAHNCINF